MHFIMAYKATGFIVALGNAIQVTEKFKKREFVIEEREEIHGNIYTNLMPMQFVNDGCSKLDGFAIGQQVEVTFHPKGSKWEKPDKEDPSIVRSGYNLNLACTSVVLVVGVVAPAPEPSPTPTTTKGLPF